MKRTKSIVPGTGESARKGSPSTRTNSRQLRITRVCRCCGQQFSAATSTSDYCSRKCYQHDYYHRNKPQILDKRNRQKQTEEPEIPLVDSDMISGPTARYMPSNGLQPRGQRDHYHLSRYRTSFVCQLERSLCQYLHAHGSASFNAKKTDKTNCRNLFQSHRSSGSSHSR